MLKVIVTSTDIHPHHRPAPLSMAQSAAASPAEEEPDDADRLIEVGETVSANRPAEMLAISFTPGHFGKIVVLFTGAVAQTATLKVKNFHQRLPNAPNRRRLHGVQPRCLRILTEYA